MSLIRFNKQTEPATPPPGKATLFVDSVDGEVAVKKDDGLVQKFLVSVTTVNGKSGVVSLDASDLEGLKIGTSTFKTLQDFINLSMSAGLTSGGSITDAGGGNVDVAAGTGFIRIINDEVSDLKFFDWIADTGIAIPLDTTRHIGIDFNAGSPIVIVKTIDEWDFDTEFPLGLVVNEEGVLHLGNIPWRTGDTITNIIERFDSIATVERDGRTKGLILGETGTRNVTVTTGNVLSRMEEFQITAMNTAVADTFDAYHKDGVGGFTRIASQTQFDNANFDDGSGTLAPLTAGFFASMWFYITLTGDLVMVYGINQFSSLGTLVSDDTTPPTPERIEKLGLLIGRVVVQQGLASAVEVDTVFETVFAATAVTDHGNLAGLADDDHTQYHTDARADIWFAGRRFISPDQTITTAGQLIIPHGLSSTPINWEVFLVCKTAQHGYSVGDVFKPSSMQYSITGNGKGVAIVPDATNLVTRYGEDANVFNVLDKSDGSEQQITNSNFDMRIIAWL